MNLLVSDIYYATIQCDARRIIHQGGQWSGKTVNILAALATIAAQQKNKVITVTSVSLPHLKGGALRDFERYIQPYFVPFIESHNKTDLYYKFKSGSIIEFKSFEDEYKARGAKRDYLFVNEANNLDYLTFFQLDTRTDTQTIIDYNPTESFWAHEKLIGREGNQLFISDHRHNPFLSEAKHKEIEGIEDRELWRVYARGLTGKIEGLILRNWYICREIPSQAKLIAGGLDFGFTNDPTCYIEVYMQDGELWIDELLYERGLTNFDIAEKLKGNEGKRIIADSAEPKSIEELRSLGFWQIEYAEKGPDSIKNGLDILKRYRLNITQRSVNLQKELRSYKYKVDKNGKTLNVPIDAFNHAIDSLRYVGLNCFQVANDYFAEYS